jgi:hypothetical protein
MLIVVKNIVQHCYIWLRADSGSTVEQYCWQLRLLLPVHVVVILELVIIFCCVHKRVGNFYTAQTIQYGFEQRPFISCIPPLTFKIEFLKLPWTMRVHFQTHDTNLGLSDHLHKIIVIELIVQCSRIPWITIAHERLSTRSDINIV